MAAERPRTNYKFVVTTEPGDGCDWCDLRCWRNPAPDFPQEPPRCPVPRRPTRRSAPPLTGLALAATAAALTVVGTDHRAPAGAEGSTPSAPAGSVTSPSSCSPTRSRRAPTPGSASTSATPPTSRRWTRGWRRRRTAPSASTSPAPRAAAATSPTSPPPGSATQLANGWRLLPITLGPAGRVQPVVPALRQRPGDQHQAQRRRASTRRRSSRAPPRRRPRSPRRRRSGSCRAARSGTTSRGTTSPTAPCRESSLYFLSAWTQQLHALGYVSGVYSSAGSGIKSLDDARVLRPGTFTLPDQIWIARWDGQANTSTTYIRSDGWMPGPPDEAVPGRPQRDVGRGDDQHRPQLPRPQLRRRRRRRPRRATAAAPRSTWPTTRGSSRRRRRPHPERRPGHRAQVPAEGAGRLQRQASRARGPSG